MSSIRHFDERKLDDSPEKFRCPECVSANDDRDFFCPSFKCPEQIPQPKFPSATSSFPPEELAEITECIEQANELLLTLGVERDSENLRTMQQGFRELRDHHVSVLVNCGEVQEKLTVKGHFVDAGLNFIILETNVGNVIMVPFERIELFEHKINENVQSEEAQELLKIGPCLRRCLTFQFGETVAKSPFLLNLFFGLELRLFLETFVGCFAYVKSEKHEREKEGILAIVNKRRVEIEIDHENHGIDFDELCFIEIEREILAKEFLIHNPNKITR